MRKYPGEQRHYIIGKELIMQLLRKTMLLMFILASFFVGSVLVVQADADVTQWDLSCNQLTASGTSDSPYVTLYAYDYASDEYYFTIVPVTGGAWSGSLSFPTAATGTEFNVEIWGTLAPYTDFDDPNYWDVGLYFDEYAPCAPPVATDCTYPLPADSVVYSVPNGASAYFNPDLQSGTNFSIPAGSWKISEFSGDFAKVWIACEAEPIWIPTSAVGGAIG